MSILLIILSITVMCEDTIPKYDRGEWGSWSDFDKDGLDTRTEVLIEEAVDTVIVVNRKVIKGKWKCPYTGDTITDPSLLDIDHFVPLKEVHLSGGWKWSKEKKREYFNYIYENEELVAVDRGSNRSKGSKTPSEWLPEINKCGYVKTWIKIKDRWKLDMDTTEIRFLLNYEDTCK